MWMELMVLVISLVVFWEWSKRRSSSMPPGPLRFPIFGNVIQLALKGRQPFISLHKLSLELGEIFTLRMMGGKDFVVLAGWNAIKETLSKEEWSGRIWNEFMGQRYLGQRLGFIFLEGEDLKTQKRFLLHQLRDLGLGTTPKMEAILKSELEEIVSSIRSRMGDGFQTTIYSQSLFTTSVLNSLWAFVAGRRFENEDPSFQSLIEKSEFLFKSQKVGGLSQMFPLLRKLFPKWLGETQDIEAYNSIHEYFRGAIAKHRSDDDLFGKGTCLIDNFISEVDSKNASSSTFKEDQLACLLTDLFLAGSETTSNTLTFAILYLVLHQNVQEKMFKEIRDTVQPNKNILVTLKDRPRLPYTEAVIMEVQRIATIAPLTPPHKTTAKASYKDYSIPKDTIVLVNLYSLNHSKELWGEDVEVFRPERFLDSGRPEYFIPFGIGKRSCPGEGLARMSLFLYLTNLVANFQFSTVPGYLDPKTKPVHGLTLSAMPFNFVVTRRV